MPKPFLPFTFTCRLPIAKRPPRGYAQRKDGRLIVPEDTPKCSFTTTEPSEVKAHMLQVHGVRNGGVAVKRFPKWRAPKPKDDPEAREALVERLGTISWQEGANTCTGQYWSDAPGEDRIWAIPNEPRPDGAHAIKLELTPAGYAAVSAT